MTFRQRLKHYVGLAVLLPIALVMWWRERKPSTLVRPALVARHQAAEMERRAAELYRLANEPMMNLERRKLEREAWWLRHEAERLRREWAA